jgi:predicted GIY-YIG superfamily endonuclease
MAQLLLFPDPRPLVERLGPDFFRRAPDRPGVYLMRDGTDTVLYVGKAKSLRKRLASYRVANPDRLPRRHLRLLRAVEHIEFEECADETSALARESELLLSLRPRFNRAGTWPGQPRFLTWRLSGQGLELAVQAALESEWHGSLPLGAGAFAWRTVVVRLLWCAVHPELGLARMPGGWFHGHAGGIIIIPPADAIPGRLEEAAAHLSGLFAGQIDQFVGWVRERAVALNHPFELAVREADLEALSEISRPSSKSRIDGQELPASGA